MCCGVAPPCPPRGNRSVARRAGVMPKMKPPGAAFSFPASCAQLAVSTFGFSATAATARDGRASFLIALAAMIALFSA